MTWLRRLVVAFLTLKLGVLLLNLATFPVLRRRRQVESGPPELPARDAADWPAVSLLIPIRNETGRLAEFLPALLAQDAEVVVLDDQSEDASYEVAAALAAAQPSSRVVQGAPAPAGWVGKNWACHQLARHASAPVLVFCDVDVLLAPGALAVAVDQMRTQGADMFSVFPRQQTGTLGEHLIVPLVDDAVLCLLPFGLLSVDQPAAATASGALMAFTRSAYDELGGHEAVRAEMVEDVSMARRTRRAGLKLGLALGGDQVEVRMYEDYRAVVRGFARGLPSVVGGSRLLLAAGLGWHLLAYTGPLALVVRERRWLLPLAMGVAERALIEIKTGRMKLWQAPLITLSPVAATPVVAQALRRRQTWRGRVYP